MDVEREESNLSSSLLSRSSSRIASSHQQRQSLPTVFFSSILNSAHPILNNPFRSSRFNEQQETRRHEVRLLLSPPSLLPLLLSF